MKPNPTQHLQEKIVSLPKSAGVYLFKSKAGEVLYVGKSTNLKARASSYLISEGPKTKRLVEAARTIEYILVDSELESLLLEAFLIKKHKPPYNTAWKDDKHHLYIKIDKSADFPKISTSRKEDNPKSIYFGPFPSASTVRQVLKDIRRVFPYCQQKKTTGRSCFYSHIGLCNPCPSNIIKIENPAERSKAEEQYKRNIKNIVDLLSGKKKKLIRRLEGQMAKAAEKENFEEAAKKREQLADLSYITRPYINIAEYLENPNLLEDIRRTELATLALALKRYLPVGALSRVECFDVSHLAGIGASASMVTFINGDPDKSLYRRFRIRGKYTKDDYKMLSEVVSRRMKHIDDWGVSDLIVIDGGKGQVSAIKKVFEKQSFDIPIIGLAKRLEEIIVPAEEGFKVIRLSKGSTALSFLQRLRDEAHRFAQAYNLKLRLKTLRKEK